MKKLNLGCGTDIRNGWVNLDIAELPGVDVVHDINKLPLPFGEDEFDYILCNDILEHLDYIPIMKELHRILRTDGVLEIKVPHFTSRICVMDPTHKHSFSIRTFEFFVKDSQFKRDYYFDFHFSALVCSKIDFKKGILFYNYVVEPIINCSDNFKNLFEATFLARIFPAECVIVKLKK
jgi:SAM-dependent methyltransferase